ncbi:DUF429 domain-containing protein [Candidatus Woesearchaeota archaeon]|nr:DUF429 domain-containing protein [Candidatus Woesearchaeota archaeon]
MLFIGVDLAWSPKNNTGLAVMEGDEFGLRLTTLRLVKEDEDIIEHIHEAVHGKPVFIAIDAPLIVPNKKGRRKAEELVGYLFGQYEAGAHPANRERLSQWSGKVRGEHLVEQLQELNIKHDPYLKPLERTRKCFEVYPHPSMVVLFKLSRTLKYKAKPKRSYEDRWAEFSTYVEHLGNLKDLHLPAAITTTEVTTLKGRALKDYEDKLDAVFCAYIAYYAWKHPKKCEVLGNMHEGYILTPVFQRKEKQLEEYFKKA